MIPRSPPFPSFSLQDGTKKRKGGDGIRDAPAPPTDVAIQHSIVVYIYIPLCVCSAGRKIKSRSAPVALDQDRARTKKENSTISHFGYCQLLSNRRRRVTSSVVAPHLTGTIAGGNRIEISGFVVVFSTVCLCLCV